jgi:hypothetical protein
MLAFLVVEGERLCMVCLVGRGRREGMLGEREVSPFRLGRSANF